MTTLFKINLKALFSGIFMKSRSVKKRSPVILVLIALLVIYVVGAFLFMSGILFQQLCRPLVSAGLDWLYFSLMGIAVFALCFIGSIFATQSQLFNAKDNELLLSLPIRPFNILMSRITALLLLDYLFEAFIVIPAGIIWIVYQPVTTVGVIFFVIAALVLPLTAMALASLFAWVIALISSRLRNKNIITMILSFALLGAYFWIYGNINKYVQALILNGAQIGEAIRKAVYPAYHLGIAITQGNVLSMLIFVICAVAPFIIVLLILSANFIKIATSNRGAAKIKYTAKALKVSGVRAAFTKKELRHFFGNPMYIMNSAIGVVIALIGAVVFVFKQDVVLGYIMQLNKTGLNLTPALLICVVLCVIAALNLVSAPSISLEGKNLWIAKSLPVKSFDVLMAKVNMHILVCGLPMLAASVIFALAAQATALQIVLILLVPFLFTVLMAFFGVTVNLQFPKFDWINEIQPIKQGVATLVSMGGSFALVAAMIVLYIFVFSSLVAAEIYMLICAAVLAILILVLYGYLKKGGSLRFEALDN